ncbi:MAG: hypothetical protein ABJB86_05860 [Bacteroidota bacterium]
MFVHVLVVLAITSLIIAAVTFVLYGRARMKEQEQSEKFFLNIHYACLFILFLVGIVYMFFMVKTET